MSSTTMLLFLATLNLVKRDEMAYAHFTFQFDNDEELKRAVNDCIDLDVNIATNGYRLTLVCYGWGGK